mmetsp:Transcript_792/g.1903  ORF Transcript_792/g.1903 Transcript_792/m.1903 type:complete len:259 (-) Transcript_792:83-859(-)
MEPMWLCRFTGRELALGRSDDGPEGRDHRARCCGGSRPRRLWRQRAPHTRQLGFPAVLCSGHKPQRLLLRAIPRAAGEGRGGAAQRRGNGPPTRPRLRVAPVAINGGPGEAECCAATDVCRCKPHTRRHAFRAHRAPQVRVKAAPPERSEIEGSVGVTRSRRTAAEFRGPSAAVSQSRTRLEGEVATHEPRKANAALSERLTGQCSRCRAEADILGYKNRFVEAGSFWARGVFPLMPGLPPLPPTKRTKGKERRTQGK